MINAEKIWIIDDNTSRNGVVVWDWNNPGEYIQGQIDDVSQFIIDRKADGDDVHDNRGRGFANSWN